jgi:hypothetical protein
MLCQKDSSSRGRSFITQTLCVVHTHSVLVMLSAQAWIHGQRVVRQIQGRSDFSSSSSSPRPQIQTQILGQAAAGGGDAQAKWSMNADTEDLARMKGRRCRSMKKAAMKIEYIRFYDGVSVHLCCR